jgi:hypothetical protein
MKNEQKPSKRKIIAQMARQEKASLEELWKQYEN